MNGRNFRTYWVFLKGLGNYNVKCISCKVSPNIRSTLQDRPCLYLRKQEVLQACSSLTKIQGNDRVTRSRCQVSKILRFLFELGAKRSTSLRGHSRSSLAEETAHVCLQQRFCLVLREDCSFLLDITFRRKSDTRE